MTEQSAAQITKWTKIIDKNFAKGHATAKERLSAYLCSLIIGREFGETTESYFARRGLAEFATWAYQAVAN